MNINYRYAILLFLVGLVAVPETLFAVSAASACFQKSGSGDEESKDSDSSNFLDPDPTSVFLPPSRELVRPLIRALRLHNEGDDNDAAELIGEFLVDSGDEDFLVWSDKSQGTATSISKAATEMLGELPKSAIKSYRVRFGVPARQRLSLGIAEADYFEIAQVMKRYPYTDAGVEAAMLMGHYHFDAGRALLAAESFQTALDLGKFFDRSDAKKPDSQLSILTAISWTLARRPELAEAVMKDLAKQNGGKIRLGDKDVLIDNEDPLAAIKTFVGSGPMDSTSTVDQWLLVGGNSRRTVTTPDGFPVGQPLWQVDMSASHAAQQKIENARETIVGSISLASKGSVVPANVPLIVDGLVLVGNKKQISAVDFKSGKRVWAVATEVGAGSTTTPKKAIITQFNIRSQSNKTLDRDPWTDFLQGHASSDGKLIFHIVKTLAAPPSTAGNRLVFSRTIGDTTTNTLQAIDVMSEGELAWEVGGGKTTGDPRLAQVSFLGAPLPIDGVLYSIGKHLQEIVLVALNSDDGSLLWMQSLASGEDTARSRYQRTTTSQSHSLTPSYSEGILVCPTGKNALVAVDTIGRRVLWGAQTTSGTTSSTRSSSTSLKTLQNPQVFVENSRVVAFDISNDARLLAVSLLDGSPLMKIGKVGVKMDDALFFAGVDESRVVVVEKDRVRALSSDSGSKLWMTSIKKFGPPSGRGYVSEKSLYLPTEGNVIIKIDLESGEVVDGVKTDQPLGNLILHEGRLISRRETTVSCFELDSKVVSELDVAAKAAGGMEQVAPALRIKRATLLRNQGEVKQAIELLQTITEDDRDELFKTEFLRNATLLFESDPEYALTLFKKYENWFQFETDPKMFLGYVELLVKYGMKDDVVLQLFKDETFFNSREPKSDAVLMQRPIAGYNVEDSEAEQKDEQDGDSKKAESTKETDKEGTDEEKTTGKDMPAFLKNQAEFNKRRISFGRNQWAKAQLIRVARKSPDAVPQIEAAIEQRIASASLIGVVEQHRFLRQFPLEFVAPQMRFELAEKLIGEGHVAEAENMLASLLGFLPTEADQIEAAEISVDDLSKDSFVELWSKIRDAQYGASIEVAADSETVPPSSKLDFNRVDVKTVPAAEYPRVYPTTVQPRGELASRLFAGKGLTIWGGKQEFEVRGPTGESETRFKMFKSSMDRRMNLKIGSGWIQTNHSLAIVRHKQLMLALDLSKLDQGQEAVLWTKSVTPVLGYRPAIADEVDLVVYPVLRQEDVTASFPTSGCCCYFDADKLTCVDAYTGATLWTRTKDDKHGNVFASGSQVVTMDEKLSESSVFDLRTGERLQTKSVSDLIESVWEIDGLSLMAVGKVQRSSLENLKDFEDCRSDWAKPGVDDDTKKSRPTGPFGKASKSGRFLSRYDASVGEFVWKKVFDDKAKIGRLSGDRFAVLSEGNLLQFYDSKTGKELAKIPTGLTEDQRKKVQSISAFEHLGKDLIVMATARMSRVSANGYRYQASYTSGTFFSGHLMLLSKDKLEPVWDQLAELDGFQLQPMLPAASPLLIFNRRIQGYPSSRGPDAAKQALTQTISGSGFQLVALDMNDGHVVANEVVSPVGTVQFNSPVVDLSAGRIDISFSGRQIELTLKTSSDEPPAPVASVTKLNPVPQMRITGEAVTKVAASKKFDIEKLNKRLIKRAEQYEASLEEKRKKERAQLEKETSR